MQRNKVMSLRINRQNIYTIVPNERYELAKEIVDFMEKDFTIFIRAKIIKKYIDKNKETFLFSRNGQHAGLALYVDDSDSIWLQFVYWFIDKENNSIYKQARFLLPENLINSFNEYVITCDDNKKVINFYVNKDKKDSINYSNLIKKDYTKSFFWLGCGDMLAEDEYNGVGTFNVDLIIGMDKCLPINEISYITKIYKTKYLEIDKSFELPILNNNIPYKENYKLFCDLNYRNRYKIWNFVDNGIFFQKYIKGNIFF